MSVITDLLTSLVEHLVLPRLDPLALYPARVVTQHEDGTCDVKPDGRRWGEGLGRVAIRHGLPGVTVKVKQGARVLLGFEAHTDENGADVRRPYLALWEPGSLDTLTVEATTKLVLKAPSTVVAQTESNA